MDDFISKETIVEAHNINSDTISRRAAIEAMKKQCEELLKGLDKNSNVYGIMSASTGIMICAVGKLPPAQPKIIRCKDCQYGILDCDFPHERYCDFKGNEWNNDNHYCGHAKRREVTE